VEEGWMTKCIILSVKPQYLHKIITGKKTIEIRKSMPKCEYPIDVYLYCTKGDINLYKVFKEVYMYFDMGVAEPFADFKYYELSGYDYSNKGKARFYTENGFYDEIYRKLNGKIVAKFTLNKVDKYISSSYSEKYSYYPYYRKITHKTGSEIKIHDVLNIQTRMCLSEEEFSDYGKGKPLYAWHIDNLQFFKKPMELRELYRSNYQVIQDYETCNNYDCIYVVDNSILGDDGYCPVNECPKLRISRPPQSWCYAYKEE
jgi:predicted transcriptional regulator